MRCLVADSGIVEAGYVERAAALLGEAAIDVCRFHDFGANPDSRMVEAGREQAASAGVDAIVAIGGGSSLDCAKGINFVLTNGGGMQRLPRLRQSHASHAANDWCAYDGRHWERRAVVRADFGCRDPREDGVRRLKGGVSNGDLGP